MAKSGVKSSEDAQSEAAIVPQPETAIVPVPVCDVEDEDEVDSDLDDIQDLQEQLSWALGYEKLHNFIKHHRME